MDIHHLNHAVLGVDCGKKIGSGFFVSNHGHFVTCLHVLGDCTDGTKVNLVKNGIVLTHCQPHIEKFPKEDMAILKVSNEHYLSISALPMIEDWPDDFDADLIGYGLGPRGTAAGNSVGGPIVNPTPLDLKLVQSGRDYELRGQVRKGDSGGPVIYLNHVVGLIVAREEENQRVLMRKGLKLVRDHIEKVEDKVKREPICNRDTELKSFSRFFENLIATPSQSLKGYLICGVSEHVPNDFVKDLWENVIKRRTTEIYGGHRWNLMLEVKGWTDKHDLCRVLHKLVLEELSNWHPELPEPELRDNYFLKEMQSFWPEYPRGITIAFPFSSKMSKSTIEDGMLEVSRQVDRFRKFQLEPIGKLKAKLPPIVVFACEIAPDDNKPANVDKPNTEGSLSWNKFDLTAFTADKLKKYIDNLEEFQPNINVSELEVLWKEGKKEYTMKEVIEARSAVNRTALGGTK